MLFHCWPHQTQQIYNTMYIKWRSCEYSIYMYMCTPVIVRGRDIACLNRVWGGHECTWIVRGRDIICLNRVWGGHECTWIVRGRDIICLNRVWGGHECTWIVRGRDIACLNRVWGGHECTLIVRGRDIACLNRVWVVMSAHGSYLTFLPVLWQDISADSMFYSPNIVN